LVTVLRHSVATAVAASVLAVTAMTGCLGGQSAPNDGLGTPVPSFIRGIPLPRAAKQAVRPGRYRLASSEALPAVFFLPAGVPVAAVDAWYDRLLPAGRSVTSLMSVPSLSDSPGTPIRSWTGQVATAASDHANYDDGSGYQGPADVEIYVGRGPLDGFFRMGPPPSVPSDRTWIAIWVRTPSL
jgi:hypothetical protein